MSPSAVNGEFAFDIKYRTQCCFDNLDLLKTNSTGIVLNYIT